MFTQQLPWLIFGLVSGAYVDRIDRRVLIVVVNTCRAATMTLLGVAVAADTAAIWLVYAALFVLGTGETLADNAGSAMVVALVPANRLGAANARLGLTFTTGNQLAGPPLGALLFAAGHAIPSFIQAVTFAAGATLISRVTASSAPMSRHRTDSTGASMIAEITTGLGWLRRHAAMRTLVSSILVMNVAFTAAFATWVLYCTRLLHLSDAQFGLLLTCAAIGGLAGPWTFTRLAPLLGHAGIVRLGFVLEGLVHLLLATVPPAGVVAATMVVFGVHTMVWGAAANTLRQRATPAELQGRITSIYFMASIGGSAVGAAIGALVSQTLGLTAAFWAAGVAMLLIAMVAWRPLGALDT